VTVTFATPSATTPDSSVTYTTTETDTVAAASGAAAPIDLHRVISYSASSGPQYGTDLKTDTIDQYENVSQAANGSFDVTLSQTVSAITGTDVTAAAAASTGAPYAYSSTSTTTYASPTTLFVLPLTAGTQWSSSLARTVNSVSTTTSAANAAYAATNLTTIFQGDDSYTESGQSAIGETTTRSVSSDGSGTITNVKAASTTVDTVGVPTQSGGEYKIPVTTTTTTSGSATPTPTDDSATDWYPGAGLPPSPLGSVNYTVVGATTTLPSGCAFSGTLPANVAEYDSTTSTVDPVAGTVTSGTSQVFNANGLVVCRITTSTVKDYSITTGELTRTTVTDTASSLTQ
jgi:hypothetical protein